MDIKPFKSSYINFYVVLTSLFCSIKTTWRVLWSLTLRRHQKFRQRQKLAKSVHKRAFLNRPRFLCFPPRNKPCFIGKISSQMGSIIMKPRKPLSLAVAAATLLATSFSPSASAELTDREASIVPIGALPPTAIRNNSKRHLPRGSTMVSPSTKSKPCSNRCMPIPDFRAVSRHSAST